MSRLKVSRSAFVSRRTRVTSSAGSPRRRTSFEPARSTSTARRSRQSSRKRVRGRGASGRPRSRGSRTKSSTASSADAASRRAVLSRRRRSLRNQWTTRLTGGATPPSGAGPGPPGCRRAPRGRPPRCSPARSGRGPSGRRRRRRPAATGRRGWRPGRCPRERPQPVAQASRRERSQGAASESGRPVGLERRVHQQVQSRPALRLEVAGVGGRPVAHNPERRAPIPDRILRVAQLRDLLPAEQSAEVADEDHHRRAVPPAGVQPRLRPVRSLDGAGPEGRLLPRAPRHRVLRPIYKE